MTSSYLFANDLRVHYLHWNLGGAGRPALLLHGLASNARIWERTAPYLAEAEMTLLAPDLRGHGLSDRPEGDYGFDTYAQDLAAFVSAANLEKPLLVGHSWGAMLALDYAARFAIGPRAPAGIVLVDGAMNQLDALPGATWEETRRRLTPPRLAGLPLESFLERLNRNNGVWKPDDQAVQIILANFEISADETISPRLSFEHHMQIVRAMWEFPTYERFRRVRCPALMIPARADGAHSAADQERRKAKELGIEAARERLPSLQVTWMEDSVHDIPLQRPEALAAEIARFAAALSGLV
jgi:pimeloyl-ACP methyl ester carboxylesterase